MNIPIPKASKRAFIFQNIVQMPNRPLGKYRCEKNHFLADFQKKIDVLSIVRWNLFQDFSIRLFKTFEHFEIHFSMYESSGWYGSAEAIFLSSASHHFPYLSFLGPRVRTTRYETDLPAGPMTFQGSVSSLYLLVSLRQF